MSVFVLHLIGGLVAIADKPPSEDQIGTGAAYLVVFLLLVAAVTFLAFSLSKQLRKTRANAEAGVFDKDPERR